MLKSIHRARTWALAMAMVGTLVLGANGAEATSIRTLNFEATQLFTGFSGLAIQAIGSRLFFDPDLNNVDEDRVTGSIVFDEDATPIDGDGTTFTFLPLIDFTIEFYHSLVSVPMALHTSTANSLVEDTATADFAQFSFGGREVGLDVFVRSIKLSSAAAPPGTLPGLAVPSANILNSMDFFLTFDVDFGFSQNQVNLFSVLSPVTFSEASVIPLPAALPLLLGSLAFLGVIGRRKHRTAR